MLTITLHDVLLVVAIMSAIIGILGILYYIFIAIPEDREMKKHRDYVNQSGDKIDWMQYDK